MTGWTIATMGISIALGASTITELKHGFSNYKHGKKGMSVVYMWLRCILFAALATALFLNPNRTGETLILAILSLWYVIFYGVLLVLYYIGDHKSEEVGAP